MKSRLATYDADKVENSKLALRHFAISASKTGFNAAHANSETDGNPALASDKEPSPETDPNGATRSSAASINDTGTQQLAGPIAVRSRAVRRTPTNVQPEDRRDPSIGLRFKVLQRDRFKCVLCGDHPARNAERVLHVDHVTPWSKGGKTREDNLRTLCATCNVGRGNRFAD
jgi:hypothetical protein